MDLSRRKLFWTLTAFAQSQFQMQKRALTTVAFNYAAKSPLADLQYFARFDVVVTGAILSADQLHVLRSGNAQLVVYQWSSAHYPGEGGPAERAWQEMLKAHADTWLLSRDPVGGAAAAPGKTAFWYDFGNSDLISALAGHIGALVQKNNYQGVFLDTLGFYSLPAQLQREFRTRHQTRDYDRCQGSFLSKLREVLGPNVIIFTNQGYRRAEFFLPHADFDLIENSCTIMKSGGKTGFRKWFEKGAEWESIEVPMNQLIMPASRAYPRTRFVHINYVEGDQGTCERGAGYSYACAKLWNQISFAAPPGVQRAIRSDLYFNNVGEPLSSSYEEDKGAGVAWRRFQNGVVAVNSSSKVYRISSLNLELADPPRGYIFLQDKKKAAARKGRELEVS
ncbi:MAG: hypothetical protein ACR2IV_00255 [Bryobacteraceae bacterium]